MEVEVGKTHGRETPASMIADQLMEHVSAIMVSVGGIESMSVKKYVCGFGSTLHVTISQFDGIPDEIREQGICIKDALAQIMSIANAERIVAKPSDSERAELMDMWSMSTQDAKSANGGSSQTFGGSSDGSDSSAGE